MNPRSFRSTPIVPPTKSYVVPVPAVAPRSVHESSASSEGPESRDVFANHLSDSELESAFEAAESDPAEMLDADAIAQRAMQETEPEFSERLGSPSSSFATRTVAELLERQGDDRGASRIRAIVDSPSGTDRGAAKSPDQRDQTIEQLERWLVNLRGGAK